MLETPAGSNIIDATIDCEARTGMQLTVTRTFAVADLGTVVFFGLEPVPLASGSRHRCLIMRPDGGTVEAVGSVEHVRKDSTGEEVPALLFETLSLADVVVGSKVSALEELSR